MKSRQPFLITALLLVVAATGLAATKHDIQGATFIMLCAIFDCLYVIADKKE